MSKKEKAAPQNGTTQLDHNNHSTLTVPLVSGQCAEILSILRKGPTLSLTLTADHAIPEAAARIHELREKGFNIGTQIQEEVVFRGKARKWVALYVLASPEWPRPGFLSEIDLSPAA